MLMICGLLFEAEASAVWVMGLFQSVLRKHTAQQTLFASAKRYRLASVAGSQSRHKTRESTTNGMYLASGYAGALPNIQKIMCQIYKKNDNSDHTFDTSYTPKVPFSQLNDWDLERTHVFTPDRRSSAPCPKSH